MAFSGGPRVLSRPSLWLPNCRSVDSSGMLKMRFLKIHVVPERKVRSGTILNFGLRKGTTAIC